MRTPSIRTPPLARSQLVEALIDPMLVINTKGQIIDLNLAARQMLDITESEALGASADEILHGWGELAAWLRQPPTTETHIQTIAGPYGWYDVQFTPLHSKNQPLTGWLIVLHNITPQKEAEAQAARLAAVVEQAQETILITDLNGSILYANPHFEAVTGYAIAEAIGQNPRLLNSGQQGKQFYKNLWKTISSGQAWHGNFINRRKDSSLYYEAATIFPIKDDTGRITHYATVKRDITAQVEAERALQESERRYRLLADNASDVIWTMNLAGSFTYVSPSVEALRGYTPEEVLQQSLVEALSPASAQQAGQIFEQFLKTIGDYPNQPGRKLELEQTCKDGSSVWTESIINVMMDENGDVIGLLGVTRDIQARKKAEIEQLAYTRQLELLNAITQAAIAPMDFQTMLQILADRLGELLGAEGCYLTLWDEEKQAPMPAAAYGPLRDSYTHPQGLAQPGEPTFTAHLWETRQPLIVPDIASSPYLSPRLAKRLPSGSVLGLPLIANQRFLGAAFISFHSVHPFTDDEIQRGEQAARQVALAILKAQLLAEAERRAAEAETLRLAGAAVASTLHHQEAVARILQELKRVVPYDSASVLLLRDHELEIVGENGFANPANVVGLRFAITEQNPNSVVFHTRQPYRIDDAPQLYEAFQLPPADHIRGWLGVPIQANEQMIGMLALDSHQPGAFTQEHARLASAFADQVAIALENSRLFEETQRLSITDSLTGLFNRRYFMSIAEREYQRARRYEVPLSLIMLDIDYFKKINDTYGHQAGDLALQELALDCNEHLRTSDMVGRYGGEELIILLPETTATVAIAVAERLRQKVAKHIIHTERASFAMTISIGLAELDDQCRDLADLIDHADRALYQAKHEGRNRVIPWGDKFQDQE